MWDNSRRSKAAVRALRRQVTVSPILRQLRDQQVRFAPREKKLEQVNRAEQLIPELDRDRTYTYEYLCYRITDFRPDMVPGTNWVNVINQATRFAERTIVVLSRSYLEHSEFGIAEWSAALRRA